MRVCTQRLVLVAALLGVAACAPTSDLGGDWTRGERGITRWQIDDGLCPGIGGGCSFDVPIAVGASVELEVDGIDGVAVTAEFTGGIAGNGRVRVDDDSNTIVPIRVVSEGPGRTALSDTSGFLDAATVYGRQPTRLDCGRYEIGRSIDWRLRELEIGDAVELPVVTGSASSDYVLACRASDAEGPILSADAIAWTVVSGSENLRIRSTGLFTSFGTSASGARINVNPQAVGDAVVRATLGALSRDLTVHVVP